VHARRSGPPGGPMATIAAFAPEGPSAPQDAAIT